MYRKKTSDYELHGNEQYEGYCVDLAKEIAQFVGSNYEIRMVRDGKFGEKLPDGTWNGMIGEIIRRVSRFASSVFKSGNRVADDLRLAGRLAGGYQPIAD